MRFLIVVHGWHVTSNGFNVHEIDAESEDEAYDKGVVIAHNRETTFDKCAFKVIAVENTEVLANRKLSFSERLRGSLAV
jgi:hypothetical protein